MDGAGTGGVGTRGHKYRAQLTVLTIFLQVVTCSKLLQVPRKALSGVGFTTTSGARVLVASCSNDPENRGPVWVLPILLGPGSL